MHTKYGVHSTPVARTPNMVCIAHQFKCAQHTKKGVLRTPYMVCQFGRRWHTKCQCMHASRKPCHVHVANISRLIVWQYGYVATQTYSFHGPRFGPSSHLETVPVPVLLLPHPNTRVQVIKPQYSSSQSPSQVSSCRYVLQPQQYLNENNPKNSRIHPVT